MAHDSIDALSVLRTCTYCDSSALATDVPAACYTAYLQGCLPPLSRELTARSIFCRSSVNAPCHVFWACRCVFSRDEYDKTGRALYVAGGYRSNFSVWTGHGYPGKHKLHTTSCMHLWLACLGTRRTETDLLRRLAAADPDQHRREHQERTEGEQVDQHLLRGVQASQVLGRHHGQSRSGAMYG